MIKIMIEVDTLEKATAVLAAAGLEASVPVVSSDTTLVVDPAKEVPVVLPSSDQPLTTPVTP